jgi:hypothetical protein
MTSWQTLFQHQSAFIAYLLCFIDEDISPLHTMQGPISRACARQLDLQVRYNLVNCFSELTLGSIHVLLIRNNGEN